MNKNIFLSVGGKNLTGGGKWGWMGRELGERGREVGERGREVGNGYPPVHPWVNVCWPIEGHSKTLNFLMIQQLADQLKYTKRLNCCFFRKSVLSFVMHYFLMILCFWCLYMYCLLRWWQNFINYTWPLKYWRCILKMDICPCTCAYVRACGFLDVYLLLNRCNLCWPQQL